MGANFGCEIRDSIWDVKFGCESGGENLRRKFEEGIWGVHSGRELRDIFCSLNLGCEFGGRI